MPQDLQDEVCAVAMSDTIIEISFPPYAQLHSGKRNSFRANKAVSHITPPNHAKPILRDTLSKIRSEIDDIKCISGDRLFLRIELSNAKALVNIILHAREVCKMHGLKFRFDRAQPICSIQPAFAA